MHIEYDNRLYIILKQILNIKYGKEIGRKSAKKFKHSVQDNL